VPLFLTRQCDRTLGDYRHAAWPFEQAEQVQAALPMLQHGMAQYIELAINVSDKVVLGLPWCECSRSRRRARR
jgi:hypothetical protein